MTNKTKEKDLTILILPSEDVKKLNLLYEKTTKLDQ